MSTYHAPLFPFTYRLQTSLTSPFLLTYVCVCVCVFFMKLEVVEIALDQCGPFTERKIALIDKNRDLYLTSVRHLGREPKICKIGEEGTAVTILYAQA